MIRYSSILLYYCYFLQFYWETEPRTQMLRVLEAFNNAKRAMFNFTKINYIKDNNAKPTLTIDVFLNVIGSAIQEVKPITFLFLLNRIQQNKNIQRFLSINMALLTREFTVYKHHNALTYVLHKNPTNIHKMKSSNWITFPSTRYKNLVSNIK